MNKKFLDAQDEKLISQLSIAAKRRIVGLVTGEQRSPHQGGGIEFADYREYEPGDDIRQVDWTVFLRLRRLMVKLCAEEKELTLMLVIDSSRSMRYGNPDKLWMACRLAAVLAGIALNDGNRAGVATLGANYHELITPERSRASLTGILKALESIKTAEIFDPMKGLRQFAARYSRKCMVVLISDLLYPEWPQTVSGLAASGCEGYVLQLLAQEELAPSYLGEVTLVDIEKADEVSLHVDWETARKYRNELAKYLLEVRQSCHRVGLGHTMIETDAPLGRILHKDLRKGGLIC